MNLPPSGTADRNRASNASGPANQVAANHSARVPHTAPLGLYRTQASMNDTSNRAVNSLIPRNKHNTTTPHPPPLPPFAWNHLNPAILSRIAQYLAPRHLAIAAQVCKTWYAPMTASQIETIHWFSTSFASTYNLSPPSFGYYERFHPLRYNPYQRPCQTSSRKHIRDINYIESRKVPERLSRLRKEMKEEVWNERLDVTENEMKKVFREYEGKKDELMKEKVEQMDRAWKAVQDAEERKRWDRQVEQQRLLQQQQAGQQQYPQPPYQSHQPYSSHPPHPPYHGPQQQPQQQPPHQPYQQQPPVAPNGPETPDSPEKKFWKHLSRYYDQEVIRLTQTRDELALRFQGEIDAIWAKPHMQARKIELETAEAEFLAESQDQDQKRQDSMEWRRLRDRKTLHRMAKGLVGPLGDKIKRIQKLDSAVGLKMFHTGSVCRLQDLELDMSKMGWTTRRCDEHAGDRRLRHGQPGVDHPYEPLDRQGDIIRAQELVQRNAGSLTRLVWKGPECEGCDWKRYEKFRQSSIGQDPHYMPIDYQFDPENPLPDHRMEPCPSWGCRVGVPMLLANIDRVLGGSAMGSNAESSEGSQRTRKQDIQSGKQPLRDSIATPIGMSSGNNLVSLALHTWTLSVQSLVRLLEVSPHLIQLDLTDCLFPSESYRGFNGVVPSSFNSASFDCDWNSSSQVNNGGPVTPTFRHRGLRFLTAGMMTLYTEERQIEYWTITDKMIEVKDKFHSLNKEEQKDPKNIHQFLQGTKNGRQAIRNLVGFCLLRLFPRLEHWTLPPCKLLHRSKDNILLPGFGLRREVRRFCPRLNKVTILDRKVSREGIVSLLKAVGGSTATGVSSVGGSRPGAGPGGDALADDASDADMKEIQSFHLDWVRQKRNRKMRMFSQSIPEFEGPSDSETEDEDEDLEGDDDEMMVQRMKRRAGGPPLAPRKKNTGTAFIPDPLTSKGVQVYRAQYYHGLNCEILKTLGYHGSTLQVLDMDPYEYHWKAQPTCSPLSADAPMLHQTSKWSDTHSDADISDADDNGFSTGTILPPTFASSIYPQTSESRRDRRKSAREGSAKAMLRVIPDPQALLMNRIIHMICHKIPQLRVLRLPELTFPSSRLPLPGHLLSDPHWSCRETLEELFIRFENLSLPLEIHQVMQDIGAAPCPEYRTRIDPTEYFYGIQELGNEMQVPRGPLPEWTPQSAYIERHLGKYFDQSNEHTERNQMYPSKDPPLLVRSYKDSQDPAVIAVVNQGARTEMQTKVAHFLRRCPKLAYVWLGWGVYRIVRKPRLEAEATSQDGDNEGSAKDVPVKDHWKANCQAEESQGKGQDEDSREEESNEVSQNDAGSTGADDIDHDDRSPDDEKEEGEEEDENRYQSADEEDEDEVTNEKEEESNQGSMQGFDMSFSSRKRIFIYSDSYDEDEVEEISDPGNYSPEPYCPPSPSLAALPTLADPGNNRDHGTQTAGNAAHAVHEISDDTSDVSIPDSSRDPLRAKRKRDTSEQGEGAEENQVDEGNSGDSIESSSGMTGHTIEAAPSQTLPEEDEFEKRRMTKSRSRVLSQSKIGSSGSSSGDGGHEHPK